MTGRPSGEQRRGVPGAHRRPRPRGGARAPRRLGGVGDQPWTPVSEHLERFPVGPILAAIVLVNVAGPLMDTGGWASSAAHGAGLSVGALYGWTLRSRERIEVSRPFGAAAVPRD
jgi:hypothetical protein